MAARGKDAPSMGVIDDQTTDTELDRFASLGCGGIRLNLSTAGINDPQAAVERFLAAGTNWPHANSAGGSTSKVTPLWQVDDGLVLNLLPRWALGSAVRKKILVDKASSKTPPRAR